MDSTNQSDYDKLREELVQIDHEFGVAHQRLFYLAIPPKIFKSVIECLGIAGLNQEDNGAASRIFIEKPFGSNLESAKDLVAHIGLHFEERQIYRIDHYLAKETAQNILAFRFNNPLVQDIWGRQFIDHIQITAAEMIGIEGRSAFYEGMGALRDIMQSHILQLTALMMMEEPREFTSTEIHAEKLALLQSVQPIKQNHVDEYAVRGQYATYAEEVANPDTHIETFVALRLEASNSRWGGVPILLRTGKALSSKVTEINVVFKERTRRHVPANILTVRIQPNEGISLQMTAKKPGFSDELQPVNMDFCYQSSFDGNNPDAYERVLVDAIAGDQTLFATSDEVLRSWEILEPVIDTWESSGTKPALYEHGTWGPDEALELAKSFGCEWLDDTSAHVCQIHP
jgi:glucose-6-phosphate 1-dehydrogenase